MLADLPDELRSLKERIEKCWTVCDDHHKQYRDRWDTYWGRYHAYNSFKQAHAGASGRERDRVLTDGKREFGAQLYIPYVFVVIETILPRMLSNRPRMLWLPRDRESEQNTENMRWLLDAQQERMRYELALQTTAKTGLVLGLGVNKCQWRLEMRDQPQLARRRFAPGWRRATVRTPIYDDPFIEDVDPYDWLWAPTADGVQNLRECFHRTWRTTEYVLERFASGDWNLLPDAQAITAEDLVGGAKDKYTEIWRGRLTAQGYTTGSVQRADSSLHEVWEYHTPTEVITILDRQWPVRAIPNPAWHGQLPFHVYRPTEVPHGMVGKSEPEPLASLEDEMNTVRSMRLDNATMKLQQSWFYEAGVLDPYEMQWGAGIMNPVNTGGMSLRDVLVPMQTGDIPNATYREVEELKADIERVSGISDQTAGAALASETATGAQLVQAAANVRIQNKTHRLELELIAGNADQMVKLNQQRIVTNRDVRIPKIPDPGAGLEEVWAWRACGPGELAGAWDIVPEGGSTAPDNVPQDRSDAQVFFGLAGNPLVNGRAIMAKALMLMGLRRPEAYLSPDQHVPPQTLDAIVDFMVRNMGVPLEQARQIVQGALDEGRQMEQAAQQGAGPGGPPPQQEPAAAAA